MATTWKSEKQSLAELNDKVKEQAKLIKTLKSEEEIRKMFDRYNEFIAHHDIEEWQPWIDKQFKK
jgi:hypothetical protein